eukprot:CAMPEP_0206426406 /NCGR_PEP_ID=MMETSP0324_2-20121206/4357_1 /ASSEMBLY_ACC=CAM_ASM_000836 /TAXON_ID=2866 /ORGANISM="Crypthecodinium cohnii, Strain Seligo" /LENGTH=67 /DNA_ID=CAMNT_0053891351 /DNA_START=263 /DNA_END=466 /DNA_ORIENTATION=-
MSRGPPSPGDAVVASDVLSSAATTARIASLASSSPASSALAPTTEPFVDAPRRTFWAILLRDPRSFV